MDADDDADMDADMDADTDRVDGDTRGARHGSGICIAIVDDDPWVGRGRSVALAELGFRVDGLWTPQDALARCDRAQWEGIDVLLVDAHDPEAGFDRFVGVTVIEHVRRTCSGGGPRIAVITGHVLNDVLRVRLADAGADFMFSHTDVRTPAALADAIVEVLGGTDRQVADARPAGRAGLNDALRWAADHVREEGLADAPQKGLPLSRRSIITARQRLRSFVPEGSGQRLPPWKEVAAFLDRARGKERRGP
jgi:CheY-like chemotaxis protein